MYHENQGAFYKHHVDRIWKELCAPDRNDWWKIDHGNRMVLFYAPLNPEVQAIWDRWTREHPDRFDGLDVLTAQYITRGREDFADRIRKQSSMYMNQYQRYDRERENVLRWSIASTTQSTLVNLRELCFVPTEFVE